MKAPEYYSGDVAVGVRVIYEAYSSMKAPEYYSGDETIMPKYENITHPQ